MTTTGSSQPTTSPETIAGMSTEEFLTTCATQSVETLQAIDSFVDKHSKFWRMPKRRAFGIISDQQGSSVKHPKAQALERLIAIRNGTVTAKTSAVKRKEFKSIVAMLLDEEEENARSPGDPRPDPQDLTDQSDYWEKLTVDSFDKALEEYNASQKEIGRATESSAPKRFMQAVKDVL